jgi:hypothetical protein
VRSQQGFSLWLSMVTERAGVSYGYTLTIWSAGALCVRRFGLPGMAEVFAFAGGGTVGYAFLVAGTAWARRRGPSGAPGTGTGAPGHLWLNAAALPAVAIAAGLSDLIPSPGPSFFLVPLVATVGYLCVLAVLVSATAAIRRARAATGGKAGPDPAPHQGGRAG